jgi:hypothetical protein
MTLMADFTGFQSEFKNNNKLKRCAQNDADHIGVNTQPASDRKGPHVGLIHKALNAFAQGHNPPITTVSRRDESDDAVFDSETAKLVVIFKTEENILNAQGRIDAIVGKKTVLALDKELPAAPDGPPGGGDQPSGTVKFRDAIVVISAIGHRAEISTTFQLSQFVKSKVVTPEYSKKTDRALTVFPLFAQTVAQNPAAVTTAVGDLLSLEDSDEGTQLGKVMMYGISLGGKQITKAAQSASAGGASLDYVGISDGAFFDNETTNSPLGLPRFPLNIPEIDPAFALFSAGRKLNVFQIKGNSSKLVNPLNNPKRNQQMWFSDMFGGEIHGRIRGCDNADVSSQCTSTGAVQLHSEAARIGEERMLSDMRQILINA